MSKVSKQMTKAGNGTFHRIQSWSIDINRYSGDRPRMTCSMNGLHSKATFRDMTGNDGMKI